MAESKKKGRPEKIIGSGTLIELRKAARNGATKETMAEICEVSRNSFYDILDRMPELELELKRLGALARVDVLGKLRLGDKSGLMWLQRTSRDAGYKNIDTLPPVQEKADNAELLEAIREIRNG